LWAIRRIVNSEHGMNGECGRSAIKLMADRHRPTLGKMNEL
jgi:hypothetical protein